MGAALIADAFVESAGIPPQLGPLLPQVLLWFDLGFTLYAFGAARDRGDGDADGPDIPPRPGPGRGSPLVGPGDSPRRGARQDVVAQRRG